MSELVWKISSLHFSNDEWAQCNENHNIFFYWQPLYQQNFILQTLSMRYHAFHPHLNVVRMLQEVKAFSFNENVFNYVYFN